MFVVNGLTNKLECIHLATADGVSVCAAAVVTGETSVCSAQCGIHRHSTTLWWHHCITGIGYLMVICLVAICLTR